MSFKALGQTFGSGDINHLYITWYIQILDQSAWVWVLALLMTAAPYNAGPGEQ